MTTYEQQVRNICLEVSPGQYNGAVEEILLLIDAVFFYYPQLERVRGFMMGADPTDVRCVIERVDQLKKIMDTARFMEEVLFLERLYLSLREWYEDIRRTDRLLAVPEN